MCEELTRYNVPLTLVHGDLYPHNATLKSIDRQDAEREYMLFDWEYAYIGHPFCDFCSMHERMKPEDVKRYLCMWSKYDTVERLEEAFCLACKLGWCFKMWTMFDYIREADPQRNSSLAVYARDYFDYVYYATVGAEG